MKLARHVLTTALVALLGAPGLALAADDFYGTTEPFSKEAVYFVLTDRFVNGDPTNDHRDQGGTTWHTFDRPVPGAPKGRSDNIGYLGGDFKGVLDNADYIRDMGFGAVWITPIVDQPDEAFSGGSPVKWGGQGPFKNVSKTPLVLGQWVKAPAGSKNKVELVIVNNEASPNIPTGGKVSPL